MSLPAGAQSGECVICMTECIVRVTTCGHPFCTACLSRYAEVSRASSLPCPMCRRPLTSTDLPPEARSALATNINIPHWAGQPRGLAPQDYVVLDTEELLEVVRGAAPRPMQASEHARLAELRQLQQQVREEEVDVVDGLPRDLWEIAAVGGDVPGIVHIATVARLAWAARRRFADLQTEDLESEWHAFLMIQLRQSEMRGIQLALLDSLQHPDVLADAHVAHPLRFAVMRRSVREPTTVVAMQREATAQRNAELRRYEARVEERRRSEAERRAQARAAANHAAVRRAAEARARMRTRWDDVRRRFGFGGRAASVAVPPPAAAATTAPQATALRAAALIADAERDARNAHAEVGI